MTMTDRQALIEAVAVEELRVAEDALERLPAPTERWIRETDLQTYWSPSFRYLGFLRRQHIYQATGDLESAKEAEDKLLGAVVVTAATVQVQEAGRAWFDANYLGLCWSPRLEVWHSVTWRNDRGPAVTPPEEYGLYVRASAGRRGWDRYFDELPPEFQAYFLPGASVDLSELDAALDDLL